MLKRNLKSQWGQQFYSYSDHNTSLQWSMRISSRFTLSMKHSYHENDAQT
jgi:hypothetical protein